MAKNWAICIGINEYHNLPSLNFAVRDAEKMRDWFVDEAGFEKDHVYLFTDNSPPIADMSKPYPSQPTYATLLRFLENRFKKRFLEAGDNLWFFFSGHGLRHSERDYLMLTDSSASERLIERTAIPLIYVTERLRLCGADNVVIVQDACRNELKDKGVGIGEEHQAGVITFASCSPAERSYEIESLQQGAFTYALLEALRLEGEGNCATVERLYQRLRYRVAEINQLHKKPRQTPYAIVEPATKYHLILLPKQATLRDIDALKMDAQEAELERDLQLAEQIWTRVLAVSPADNQALKALKRIWGQSPSPSKSQQALYQSQSSSKSVALPTFEFEVVSVNAKGKEVKREKRWAKYIAENLGDGVTLEMVSIPAGSFMMGSPETEKNSFNRERPQHRVNITEFFMGKYQVTQAQWRQVAALPQVKTELNPDPSDFKGDNRPVESVSWLEAMEFCARLSKYSECEYRLPSEAEWEYACRAGTTTPFHFGETITPELVNYNGNHPYGDALKGEYRAQTTDVGSFNLANAFGLYDMHGNVWEWCADDWHDNYEGAPTDLSIWIDVVKDYGELKTKKPLRGGSWFYDSQDCRSAFRFNDIVRNQDGNYGFRVVCVVR
ncbi:SUMF1/EgtB/PvdO family nonheme iron enzyme [Pseudanabaena minima]|uniref:SUMF1/EgtB/PvdO family nonheme iron enzyme n=1 Tax=Pseudanabaena minima TaxID=890415 RepID=UPI003DA9D6D3